MRSLLTDLALPGAVLACTRAPAARAAPKWNSHKYLIDRSGKAIASFPSAMAPDSRQLVSAIEAALRQKP